MSTTKIPIQELRDAAKYLRLYNAWRTEKGHPLEPEPKKVTHAIRLVTQAILGKEFQQKS